ncbi:hypothetical protein M8J77_000828 [Diaphorina citri]|nr:hypothetical protein M8J77_000828 [Diaphorina citri]
MQIATWDDLEMLIRSQVLPALNKAIDDREEGIVVKEPDALYKPNSRKDGWYKIKPEYTEGAMVELDMLIIGGYYGKGSQRGIVSQFLLGLLDRSNDGEPNSKGPRFVSAGKVGIGLSMEELVDLSQKMSPHWNRTRVGQLPDRIEWTREKPDLWIAPEHSYVLQVKATEVVRSDAFKVQYCLRFPRIQAVRYDKTPGDCLTVEEFHGIRTRGQGKLCYESISMGSTLSSLGKLTRSPRKRKEATLGTEYTCNIQEGGVTLRSHVFKGRSLCVMTGGDTERKNTLELAILEHGGKVVQNCGPDTWCCVVTEERNIRVRHIVSGGNYNVVRLAWLERCVARKTLLEWTPDEVLCLVGDALIEMNNKYDPYGDSYTEPLSVERLASLLNRIDQAPILTAREVEELENELYVSANKHPVSTNRNGVSANRSNESTNSSVLSANSNTSASSHGVSSNRDGVSANREGVSANITSVATNSSTVSTNKSAMFTNSNTLSVNIEGVSSNSSTVSTNKISVSANKDPMSVNRSTVSANKGAVFRGCLAYFTVSSRLSRVRFRFYGGIICDALSDRVTHVVVGRESEVREMKEMLGRVGEGGRRGEEMGRALGGTGGGFREGERFEEERGGGERREEKRGKRGVGEGTREVGFVDEKWIEKCIRSGTKLACTTCTYS